MRLEGWSWTIATALALAGCRSGSDGSGSETTPGDEFVDPGQVVELATRSRGELAAALDEATALDAAGIADEYAVSHGSDLGYDPLEAEGLDLIQASAHALTDSEQALLQANGFAILANTEFPSFFYGYSSIYSEDLPVFVSADSVLDAVHRSFDDILKTLEREVLVAELDGMLASMHTALASGADELSGQQAQDADLFLTVARSLLAGNLVGTVGVADPAAVKQIYVAAVAADGEGSLELFGVNRRVDYSQFEPRGHYAGIPTLEQYFRAMIWLGRIDFRLIETQDSNTQVFRRRQLEAALGLRALMDEPTRARWDRLDEVISLFVGEHDYMTPPELDALLDDLGGEIDAHSDQELAEAIVDGGYGEQRIASHLMIGGLGETLPLSRSFAFFGQRYTVDSHVFSNVVFDRVGGGAIARYLPNPLDAAFAALANDQAVSLLADELAEYPYAGDLAAMRTLVDAHPAEYWESSLYTRWLAALRTLSPSAPDAAPDASGLPTVATTEAWGRRLLNAQLGSWSELRHDTILYVKQSYTVGTVCVFPEAYVEPYPEFFGKLVAFAEAGQTLIDSIDVPADLGDRVRDYFTSLAETAGTLQQMAEHQRTGLAHTSEHLAFINDAIRVLDGGSGPPSPEGWYNRLFFDASRSVEYDPVIADVHTDFGGDRPSRVLHVGTARPRLMVVTTDSCEGPYAYLGLAFAYHEVVEPGLNRLTDVDWQERIAQEPPTDVPWLTPVIAR